MKKISMIVLLSTFAFASQTPEELAAIRADQQKRMEMIKGNSNKWGTVQQAIKDGKFRQLPPPPTLNLAAAPGATATLVNGSAPQAAVLPVNAQNTTPQTVVPQGGVPNSSVISPAGVTPVATNTGQGVAIQQNAVVAALPQVSAAPATGQGTPIQQNTVASPQVGVVPSAEPLNNQNSNTTLQAVVPPQGVVVAPVINTPATSQSLPVDTAHAVVQPSAIVQPQTIGSTANTVITPPVVTGEAHSVITPTTPIPESTAVHVDPAVAQKIAASGVHIPPPPAINLETTTPVVSNTATNTGLSTNTESFGSRSEEKCSKVCGQYTNYYYGSLITSICDEKGFLAQAIRGRVSEITGVTDPMKQCKLDSLLPQLSGKNTNYTSKHIFPGSLTAQEFYTTCNTECMGSGNTVFDPNDPVLVQLAKFFEMKKQPDVVLTMIAGIDADFAPTPAPASPIRPPVSPVTPVPTTIIPPVVAAAPTVAPAYTPAITPAQ